MHAVITWVSAPVNLVLIAVVIGAIIDVSIRWIPDTFTAVTAGALVASALHAGITPTQTIDGVLCAIIAFLVYVELGVYGYFGGGDVKFIPIPAAILGAVSPALALVWFTATIGLAGGLSATGRAMGLPAGIPHLPAVAVTFAAASCLAVIF